MKKKFDSKRTRDRASSKESDISITREYCSANSITDISAGGTSLLYQSAEDEEDDGFYNFIPQRVTTLM